MRVLSVNHAGWAVEVMTFEGWKVIATFVTKEEAQVAINIIDSKQELRVYEVVT